MLTNLLNKFQRPFSYINWFYGLNAWGGVKCIISFLSYYPFALAKGNGRLLSY